MRSGERVAGVRRGRSHTTTTGRWQPSGRGRAVVNLRHLRFSGVPAWVMWAVIHILPLIGFRNRIVVAADWLWSYLTGKREARLITAGHGRLTDL